ncbi:MAG: LacI family DNA-binding transcriptional regulator [Prolixibacteraceae bacterium]|nr:LacI family DNA-binding transcriptional regulator [Prolixibacteraceae bacterium]
MKTIAERCGVSKALVSRILNEDPSLRVTPATRQKVIEAVEDLQYRRNANARILSALRTPKNQKTLRIGYLSFSSRKHTGHPYFSRIIDGINEQAARCHAEIQVAMGMDEARMQADYLLKSYADEPLDGMIILGKLEDMLLHRTIDQIARYIVCMDKDYDNRSDYVGTDSSKSILLALEHLYKIGYTDYALVYGGSDGRRESCLNWMKEHQLTARPEWQIDGEFSLDIAQINVTAALEKYKPPSAFVVSNDEMAIGCILALQKAGYRVPEDVAVTGHDDILLSAYVDVPLTTVHIYKNELGQFAVKVLLDRVETGRKPPISLEVDGKLIRRDSCGYKLKAK